LLLDGVEPNSTVPLDNPMGDRGTNETLKPLTRKDNTWALAPLRECVSNSLPSAEARISGDFARNKSLL